MFLCMAPYILACFLGHHFDIDDLSIFGVIYIFFGVYYIP